MRKPIKIGIHFPSNRAHNLHNESLAWACLVVRCYRHPIQANPVQRKPVAATTKAPRGKTVGLSGSLFCWNSWRACLLRHGAEGAPFCTYVPARWWGGRGGGGERRGGAPARVIVQDTAVRLESVFLCYIGRVVLFGFITMVEDSGLEASDI